MTTTNLLCIIGVSLVLGAGAWGLGISMKRHDPGYRVSVAEARVDELRFVSYAATVPPTEEVGVSGEATLETVEEKFNDLVGEATIPISFDAFRKQPEVLAEALPDAQDSKELMGKLVNPEKEFQIETIAKDELLNVLRPREGEWFRSSVEGQDVGFIWVDGVRCWFSANEMAAPPTAVSLEIVGTLKCKSPTLEQWQTALSAVKESGSPIKELDSGNGEYLRSPPEGMVVGQSDFAKDSKWDKATEAGKRLALTEQKAAARQVPMSEAKNHPRYKNLTGAAALRDNSGLLRQIQSDLQKEANANAKVTRETFSYRWVIESPLP